jgi:hypothetical protein
MPKKTSMRKKRGGEDKETKKRRIEAKALFKEKMAKNKLAAQQYDLEGKYLKPEYEGPQSDFVAPDGTVITPRTRNEMVRTGNTVYTDWPKLNEGIYTDPMSVEIGRAVEAGEVSEDPMDPIFGDGPPVIIGGKKRKTNKRRKSNKNKRKNTKRKYKKRK